MSYNSEDYFLSNDFKAILKNFEEADDNERYTSLDPDELVDIAEYYYNNGDTGKAEEIVNNVMSFYPGNPAPLLFKARMALIESHDIPKAEHYTEQIEDKTDLEYFYIKAEIMLVEKQAARADMYLEDKFTEIDEDDKDYFTIDSAALFLDYNETDIAEKWLKRCYDKESVD